MSDDSDNRLVPFPRQALAHANENIPAASTAPRPDDASPARPDRQVRLDDLQQRLRAHCARHKPVWIGRETFKLTVDRVIPRRDHPAPSWARNETRSMAGIARQARQNVESRITRRLSRVNAMRAPEAAQRQAPALSPVFNRSNRITP